MSLSLAFFFPFYYIFFHFCLSGWVFLPPCAFQSLAVLISLRLSLIFSALAVSASLSLPLCISFSGSFILLLSCYTALSAVTASQDLILTLLAQCSSFVLHPYSFTSFLGPRLRLLSSCISYRIHSSPCLSATLQRSSFRTWKSCSTQHLQVRIVFNESFKPKAENWHSDKFTHTLWVHIQYTSVYGYMTSRTYKQILVHSGAQQQKHTKLTRA